MKILDFLTKYKFGIFIYDGRHMSGEQLHAKLCRRPLYPDRHIAVANGNIYTLEGGGIEADIPSLQYSFGIKIVNLYEKGDKV